MRFAVKLRGIFAFTIRWKIFAFVVCFPPALQFTRVYGRGYSPERAQIRNWLAKSWECSRARSWPRPTLKRRTGPESSPTIPTRGATKRRPRRLLPPSNSLSPFSHKTGPRLRKEKPSRFSEGVFRIAGEARILGAEVRAGRTNRPGAEFRALKWRPALSRRPGYPGPQKRHHARHRSSRLSGGVRESPSHGLPPLEFPIARLLLMAYLQKGK
jgi:hypothetical protein